MVKDYIYMGVYLDLVECNTESVYKRGQNRVYFIEEALVTQLLQQDVTYPEVFGRECRAATCWVTSVRCSDTKKFNKLIKRVRKWLCAVDCPGALNLIIKRRMLNSC